MNSYHKRKRRLIRLLHHFILPFIFIQQRLKLPLLEVFHKQFRNQIRNPRIPSVVLQRPHMQRHARPDFLPRFGLPHEHLQPFARDFKTARRVPRFIRVLPDLVDLLELPIIRAHRVDYQKYQKDQAQEEKEPFTDEKNSRAELLDFLYLTQLFLRIDCVLFLDQFFVFRIVVRLGILGGLIAGVVNVIVERRSELLNLENRLPALFSRGENFRLFRVFCLEISADSLTFCFPCSNCCRMPLALTAPVKMLMFFLV